MRRAREREREGGEGEGEGEEKKLLRKLDVAHSLARPRDVLTRRNVPPPLSIHPTVPPHTHTHTHTRQYVNGRGGGEGDGGCVVSVHFYLIRLPLPLSLHVVRCPFKFNLQIVFPTLFIFQLSCPAPECVRSRKANMFLPPSKKQNSFGAAFKDRCSKRNLGRKSGEK